MAKDTVTLGKELNRRLLKTISYHDSAEAFYHGFLLGILSNAEGCLVKSNREAGGGRSDISLKVLGSRDVSAVFELKIAKKAGEMESTCRKALGQIRENYYTAELEGEGYRDVMCFGVAFHGKECMVAAI